MNADALSVVTSTLYPVPITRDTMSGGGMCSTVCVVAMM